MTAVPIPQPGDRLIVHQSVWYDPPAIYRESEFPDGLYIEWTVDVIAMAADVVDGEILVTWRSVDGNGFAALDRPARSMECAYGVHILGWAWPDPDVIAGHAARLWQIAEHLGDTEDPPIESVRDEIGERVYNACKRNGIDTVGQARRISDDELVIMRAFGKWSLARLRAAVGGASLADIRGPR